jgi:uncharacterized membrane protein
MAERRTGWRLAPRLRKLTLVLHIVSGVGWMGLDVGLFLLLLTGLRTDDGQLAAACYRAVAVIVPVAVPVLSLGMLLTGLLLGWGTTWGLLRYWWVFAKLVMGVVLTVLVFIALVPGVNDLATPDPVLSAEAVRDRIGSATTQLMYPPIVSFTMLGIAEILSIFKPWGRTPWTPAAQPRSAPRSAPSDPAARSSA